MRACVCSTGSLSSASWGQRCLVCACAHACVRVCVVVHRIPEFSFVGAEVPGAPPPPHPGGRRARSWGKMAKDTFLKTERTPLACVRQVGRAWAGEAVEAPGQGSWGVCGTCHFPIPCPVPRVRGSSRWGWVRTPLAQAWGGDSEREESLLSPPKDGLRHMSGRGSLPSLPATACHCARACHCASHQPHRPLIKVTAPGASQSGCPAPTPSAPSQLQA